MNKQRQLRKVRRYQALPAAFPMAWEAATAVRRQQPLQGSLTFPCNAQNASLCILCVSAYQQYNSSKQCLGPAARKNRAPLALLEKRNKSPTGQAAHALQACGNSQQTIRVLLEAPRGRARYVLQSAVQGCIGGLTPHPSQSSYGTST